MDSPLRTAWNSVLLTWAIAATVCVAVLLVL